MAGIKPKNLTEAHLRRANIGQDYWECDFNNFQGPQKAKMKTVKYLTELAEMKDQGIGILYVGPNGPGKTTLAMIAMKYLVRANWNVFCTSLGEIVENIQKSWGNTGEAETSGFIERSRTADFLLIDDVGKEHRGQSGFSQNTFDNLIRYRVQHRLPTFLTTNLTRSELRAIYGESAISLLEGKLHAIIVEGDDHRRTVLKRDVRERFNQEVERGTSE